jgi:hypothetical protein
LTPDDAPNDVPGDLVFVERARLDDETADLAGTFVGASTCQLPRRSGAPVSRSNTTAPTVPAVPSRWATLSPAETVSCRVFRSSFLIVASGTSCQP